MDMAVILIKGPLLYLHIFIPLWLKASHDVWKKVAQRFQMRSFKYVDERTDKEREVITIAHPEPIAQVS